jgi:hypothetical protein
MSETVARDFRLGSGLFSGPRLELASERYRNISTSEDYLSCRKAKAPAPQYVECTRELLIPSLGPFRLQEERLYHVLADHPTVRNPDKGSRHFGIKSSFSCRATLVVSGGLDHMRTLRFLSLLHIGDLCKTCSAAQLNAR